MNSEDDMPMPMSDDGEPSGEKPDAEPRADKEYDTTLKIKGTFNDALRVFVGKKPRKSPSV